MAISPSDLNASLARAQSEYLEMPGLSVTVSQASRLWNVPPDFAEALLGLLSTAGSCRSCGTVRS
jgi:hypothetical protein